MSIEWIENSIILQRTQLIPLAYTKGQNGRYTPKVANFTEFAAFFVAYYDAKFANPDFKVYNKRRGRL